jgi:hypothetical protein
MMSEDQDLGQIMNLCYQINVIKAKMHETNAIELLYAFLWN